MPATARSRLTQRGAVLVLFTLLLPVLIMLIGLAIDATMLYIVQAKLSAAVDGAALGAGRLLGTAANTTEIANEFLNANFPAGFWGSVNLRPDIRYSRTLNTHTITISATVDVPLMFMRILGRDTTLVRADGVATRRDTRIVLVLDRSGSLCPTPPNCPVFEALRAGAIQFTNMFNPGADELGLVVFGGSALVAYPPTRPYNPSPASAGGPDVNFATAQPGGSMLSQLNAMVAGGGTNMAEGLSLAYIEIQKARRRDLAMGADTRLNSIVLFTDGVPSALAAYLNDPFANSLKAPGATNCTYNPASFPGTKMIGWIATPGYPPTWGTPLGIFTLSSRDNQTVNYWMGHPTADQVSLTTPIAGCYWLDPSRQRLNDLLRIPPTDYYGNSTGGTGYVNSTEAYNGTAYNPASPTSGYHIGLACWNATDNAGYTARQDPMGIAIYTIGYNGAGGIDSPLLMRLANTAASSSYSPSQQTGLFVLASDTTQLAEAFRTVASELLRLAQ